MSLKPIVQRAWNHFFQTLENVFFFLKFEKYKHLFTKQQNYVVLHNLFIYLQSIKLSISICGTKIRKNKLTLS